MTPFRKSLDGDLNETILRLSGYINEDASFGPFVFQDVKKLNIDFSDVSIINSTGILTWISWINAVQVRHPSLPIFFTGCPKVIVDQINNIKGFLPTGAVVRSFMVPYRCEACKQNYYRLLVQNKDYFSGTAGKPGKIDLTPPQCPKCTTDTTPDFVVAKYLHFLQPLLKAT